MSFIDQGTLGAYRQTWRKGNPRSILKTIIDANPKADAQAIYRLFWAAIEDDKELLQDITGYWLDHNLQSLMREAEPPTRRRTKSPVATPSSTKLQDRIEHEVRIALLDLMMPNGKPLRDCTGNDCQNFNGWTSELSKRVPANNTVGSTLSEAEVYELWQAAAQK